MAARPAPPATAIWDFRPAHSGARDVSGLGSTWTTAATLAIGGNLAAAGGDGRLTISDGGAVSAAAITLYSSGEIVLEQHHHAHRSNYQLRR